MDLQPHEHWHIDVAYLHIGGTFYYLCSVLDGYSRSVVHWEIREQMTAFRREGFGAATGTYEAGVYGISAPVFEAGERCVGGVAVATPTSRITPELKAAIHAHLKKTAIEISHAWGGDIPQDVLEIWNV